MRTNIFQSNTIFNNLNMDTFAYPYIHELKYDVYQIWTDFCFAKFYMVLNFDFMSQD